MIEVALAAALAVAVLWLLLAPSFGGGAPAVWDDPVPLEETERGQALLAIKDLEFDHATAKIDDADYRELRERFTREALAVLDAPQLESGDALVASRRARGASDRTQCPSCGPRPEPGARFCSRCGALLT